MASESESVGPDSGKFTLCAAERRDEEDSISVGRAAIKSYCAAVRRPDGIHIVSGVVGQSHPIPAVHQPDVDVGVVIFGAAPDKSDLVAVR
jgi:hypothetical protein